MNDNESSPKADNTYARKHAKYYKQSRNITKFDERARERESERAGERERERERENARRKVK